MIWVYKPDRAYKIKVIGDQYKVLSMRSNCQNAVPVGHRGFIRDEGRHFPSEYECLSFKHYSNECGNLDSNLER